MTKNRDRLAEYQWYYFGVSAAGIQGETAWQRITAAVKKEESKEEFSRSEREKRVSKFPSM